MSANINRTELAEILEEYGGSLKFFDQLREDSYIRALAGQSLERLEHCLRELFYPGQTAEQARLKCPTWPPGTPRAGELPGVATLNRIIEAFNTEQCVNNLEPIRSFLDQFRKAIKATPLSDNAKMTEAVIALAGQELIKRKQSGMAISDQLDVLDRMQNQQMIDAQKQKLSLQRDKFEFDAAKACLKELPSLRQISANPALNENDKINAVRARLFGQLPTE